MKQTTATAYLGLVITFILWGSLYVVSKVLLDELPTFSIAFLRFLIAYLALTCFFRISGSKSRKRTVLDKSAWKYVILIGVGGYSISVGLQLLGTKFAGASTASLINALNPIAISVMALLFLHEAMTRTKIIGILLSVIGVYMILGTGANVSVLGVCLSLLSVLGWAFVSVITRKGLAKYDSLTITRYAIGVAALCNFVFCIIETLQSHSLPQLHPGSILGLLYMGIFCTGISYILWNLGLAKLPASNCSALYPIQPLTSTVLSILFFKESITIWFVIGAFCIIGGILLSLLVHPAAETVKSA